MDILLAGCAFASSAEFYAKDCLPFSCQKKVLESNGVLNFKSDN